MYWHVALGDGATMTDNELKLKKAQIEAIVVVGVIAWVVLLAITAVVFYYLDKWQSAGCL